MGEALKHPERGLSVVELLVSLGVLAIVGATIVMALSATMRANNTIVPAAERIAVRERVATELRTAQDGALELGFFDATATVRSLLESGSTSLDAKGGSDEGGGKDPGGGGGGGGNHVPIGTSAVDGVYGWGTGVLVGGRRVLGPVAVWNAEVVSGQEGPLVVSIRTEPHAGAFKLSENFVSSSRRIRLTASSARDVARITSLRDGDILYVNGLSPDQQPATAIAALVSEPRQIPAPAIETSSNAPAYVCFEVSVAAPDAPYDYGLSNAPETAQGVTILSSASVTLLDRVSPVVDYYTAAYQRDPTETGPMPLSTGAIGFFRTIGDPAAPASAERLLDDVGDRLTATLTYESQPTSEPTPADEQILAVGLPLLDTPSRSNADLIRCALRLPSRSSALSIGIDTIGGSSK